MPDVKNVINGLECHLGNDKNHYDCDNCQYGPMNNECDAKLIADVLVLLKSQEPVEPKIVDTSNSKLYHNDMFKNHYCGNCGEFLHVVNRKDMFCSQCGRAVKWE